MSLAGYVVPIFGLMLGPADERADYLRRDQSGSAREAGGARPNPGRETRGGAALVGLSRRLLPGEGPRRPRDVQPDVSAGPLCRASRGGDDGYEKAGYHLIRHISSFAPDEIEEDWDRHLQDLADLILTTSDDGRMLVPPDHDAVLASFDRRVPRCMALVPRRRRGTFLAGVYRYVLHEGHMLGE